MGWLTILFISETTIGNHCTADSDCIEVNSICLDGICSCGSMAEHNKTTRSCDRGGQTTCIVLFLSLCLLTYSDNSFTNEPRRYKTVFGVFDQVQHKPVIENG